MTLLTIRIVAHIINGKRMYMMGYGSFAEEEVMMKALRGARCDPVVTETGITYTVSQEVDTGLTADLEALLLKIEDYRGMQ